jgi:hypothetical protein
MNRKARRLPASLVLCAALGVLSLSPAQAGGAINKCVDGAGRVTLTDQACDAGTVSSTIAVPGTSGEERATLTTMPAVATAQRRPVRWAPAAGTTPHAALSSDMATMKQARVRMLLQDAAPRTRLALLER